MSTDESNPAGRVWLRVAVRVALGVVILGVGIGAYAVLVALKPGAPRSNGNGAGLEVQSIVARAVGVPRAWRGYGSARAKWSSDVSAEVSGVVVDRPEALDPGVWVDKGTVIGLIDDTEYAARLARSEKNIASLEAQLRGLDVEAESVSDLLALAQESAALTEAKLERLRSAIGAGSASAFETEDLQIVLTRVKREVDSLEERLNLIPSRRAQLEGQLESERASATIAALDVERCRIKAPISGVVQEVLFDEGERVGLGTPLARLVDLRLIEVPVRVPLSAARWLGPGDDALLTASGAGGRCWDGAVVRVAPEADAATRTVTLFVEVGQGVDDRLGETVDLKELLLPGQFLMGDVSSREVEERVVVPRGAVLRDRVMVVDGEGRAEARVVEVLFNIDASFSAVHPHERQWSVLSSGVEPGDRVIISNLDEVSHGLGVTPVDVGELVAGGNGGGSS